MEASSEYIFPIFISSTDYNLKDFRAELARFLTELGYRPILSSAEGFPDNSPKLEPWESCIPVLDKAFVMILVIDGKYGYPLKWINSGEIFKDKEISPTHGEYVYAHKTFKRMLVFIRSEVMTYYHSYRRTLKKCGNNLEEAEKILSKTLPEYIDFKTLQFVHEVKTTKPIPWIKEFDDITSVKKEVQKKMLNELAELFLVKNMHLETVVESFNKVIESLSNDEQKKVLQKINVTKDLTDAVEKITTYQKELNELKDALDKTKATNSQQKKKYEKRISNLQEEISKLERESLESTSNQYYIKDGKIQLGNPNYLDSSSIYGITRPVSLGGHIRTCDSCSKLENDSSSFFSISPFLKEFRTCPRCSRYLCNTCWPHSTMLPTEGIIGLFDDDVCPRCVNERKQTGF